MFHSFPYWKPRGDDTADPGHWFGWDARLCESRSRLYSSTPAQESRTIEEVYEVLTRADLVKEKIFYNVLHQRLLFDDLMCLHVGNRTTSRYILQTLCIVLTFCIEFCNAACLCLWPKMCSFHVLTHKNQKWKNDHLNFSIISAKGSFVPSLSPFLKTSPEIMRYPTFVHFLQQFVNLCLQPFLRCHGPGLKKGP